MLAIKPQRLKKPEKNLKQAIQVQIKKITQIVNLMKTQ